MNARILFIAIMIMLVPAVYAGWGILQSIHALLGN